MTSPFDARETRVSGSIDRAFGEVFTFTARKHAADVNLPRVADASRATFSAIGIWTSPSSTASPAARGRADSNALATVASMPRVSVADNGLTWVPVEGDLAGRDATGETFAVARTLPDGFGRTVLHLTSRMR